MRPALSADLPNLSASTAMRRWVAGGDRPRVLLVARWPVGGVRAHLLATYSALCAAGIRFTFVGPDGAGFERLRAGFDGIDGLEFAPAVVENQRCRLWPIVQGLLREGRFGVLHAHGLTAAAHSAMANLGVGIPHLVSLHDKLRPNQYPGGLGCLKRWMLRRALQQADAIVVPGEDARRNLLEHVPTLRGRVERLLTIAHGMQTERWLALLQALAARTLSLLPSEPLAA